MIVQPSVSEFLLIVVDGDRGAAIILLLAIHEGDYYAMSQRYLHKRRRHNHPVSRGRDNGKVAGPPKPNLAVVRRVARSRLRMGTVVWGRIPYAEGQGHKMAPAVVAEVEGHTVWVHRITTSQRRHGPRHHEVQDLEAAGLVRASGIDRRRIAVDYLDLDNITGELAADDRAAFFGEPVSDGGVAA